MGNRIKIGITMGDPSGVGPVIIAKALSRLKLPVEYAIIGDRYVFDRATKSQSHKVTRQTFIDLNNVSRKGFSFGRVRAEYGRAAVEYLDAALLMLQEHKIDCLVTCPISKEAVTLSGRSFFGHTEYMARATHTKNFVMMLLNKELKISLVTRHIPLSKVTRSLSAEEICRNVHLSVTSLKKLFLIKNPRIVVCGVNPHASDNGVIGKEEIRTIIPAINRLKGEIGSIDGPISADVALHQAHSGAYDCVIAMYHDQALIPLKLCASMEGVNLTLGLPFVRTSPLHGTGFDIAANPALIDPASLIEAIKLAARCTQNLKKA